MNKIILMIIIFFQDAYLNAVITLKIELNHSDPRQYGYWKRLKEDGDTNKEIDEATRGFIVIESETKCWPLSRIIGERYNDIISGKKIEIPALLVEDSGQEHPISYIRVCGEKKVHFFCVEDGKTYFMRLKPKRITETENSECLTYTILDKYGVIEVEEQD